MNDLVRRLSYTNVVPTMPSWLSTRLPILEEDINLFLGGDGLGKGILMCNLAARVSRGWPMPPAPINPCEPDAELDVPGSVIMVHPEDKPSDTMVHRLMAAGADLDKVYNLTRPPRAKHIGNTLRSKFSLPQDIPLLRRMIEVIGDVKLVTIDPLMATATTTVAFNSQLRMKILDPLQEVAEDTGVAVILVQHMRKGARLESLEDGAAGSKGLTDMARVINFIGRDPNDSETKVIINLKNPGIEPEPLRYQIRGEPPAAHLVFEQPIPEQLAGIDALEAYVLQLLIDAGRAVSSQEVAMLAKVDHPIVKMVLQELVAKELVAKIGRSYVAQQAITPA